MPELLRRGYVHRPVSHREFGGIPRRLQLVGEPRIFAYMACRTEIFGCNRLGESDLEEAAREYRAAIRRRGPLVSLERCLFSFGDEALASPPMYCR